MGVRFPSAASSVALGAPPANGAETAIVTSPPINLTQDFAQVMIWWFLLLAVGAGTTSYLVNVRRGSGIGGNNAFGGQNVAVTASTTIAISGCAVDVPGAVAGLQYTVTVTGTGTTGAWANAGSLDYLLVLSL